MRPILETLFLIFTTISAVHAYYDSYLCPTSTCGTLSMYYPFKLPSLKHPHKCSYIDLTCDSTNRTILHLPYAGDFHVHDIRYYSSEILLDDPGDCLMGRLMKTTLNLSSSPFRTGSYERNFTYITCPANAVIGQIFGSSVSLVDCLSNSTNSTFVSIFDVVKERIVPDGCEVIGSWMIPALIDYEGIGNNVVLYLTWDYTCAACEDKNGDEDGSDSGDARTFLIPSIIMIATLFVVCLIHIIRSRINKTTDLNPSMVEITLPVTATAPPAASGGLDESKINSCTELEVLSETRVENLGSDCNTCIICLGSYQPQQLVRSIINCKHCFHAYCIEQWLSKQETCPVCRTVLSDIDL